MSICQVFDIHIIADAGPVPGIVICPEQAEFPSINKRSENIRNQMGLRVVRLSYTAKGIGADHVEIPQTDAAYAIGKTIVIHHVLDVQLGRPVRIDRILRVRFIDGSAYRLPVDGGGRREHHFVHAMRPHGVQKIHSANDVVTIILAWIPHGLRHLGGRGHMDHGFHVPPFECLVYVRRDEEVAFENAEKGTRGLQHREDASCAPGTRGMVV